MTAKQEVEKLMNELVPFAKKMLADHGEFFPFGGMIKTDGTIAHLGAQDPATDRPPSARLLELLKRSLQEAARQGACRATGIVADVRVLPPGKSGKSDAIQVCLDHESGYSATVFYPYKKTEGGVEYGTIFAQQGEADIFRRS